VTPSSNLELTGVAPESQQQFDIALLSDVGNDRPGNEDSCGHFIETAECAIFVVADGVGGYEGGEVASAMAVEMTIAAYRESPEAWGAAKRLHRAVQKANIEIHNKALAVPELRRMATTITAAAVSNGTLYAAHVGDCRMYLIRNARIRQLTRDHTVIGERVRMGLITAERARNHPERSALNRCLGHELIVSIDLITMPLSQGDRVIICSDGLHTVLRDEELEHMTREIDATAACRRLIEAANERGTADNLTVATFLMTGETPNFSEKRPWRERLFGLFGKGGHG
jgi:serine/threonine protein phosphatase PrpC